MVSTESECVCMCVCNIQIEQDILRIYRHVCMQQQLVKKRGHGREWEGLNGRV